VAGHVALAGWRRNETLKAFEWRLIYVKAICN
jgi:hypothetical protein